MNLIVHLHQQITTTMNYTEKFNQSNPLVMEIKKDGLTLEIRERGYFIMLSNGKITKKGIRLNNELKTYFGV
jgi:hypothetical protein